MLLAISVAVSSYDIGTDPPGLAENEVNSVMITAIGNPQSAATTIAANGSRVDTQQKVTTPETQHAE